MLAPKPNNGWRWISLTGNLIPHLYSQHAALCHHRLAACRRTSGDVGLCLFALTVSAATPPYDGHSRHYRRAAAHQPAGALSGGAWICVRHNCPSTMTGFFVRHCLYWLFLPLSVWIAKGFFEHHPAANCRKKRPLSTAARRWARWAASHAPVAAGDDVDFSAHLCQRLERIYRPAICSSLKTRLKPAMFGLYDFSPKYHQLPGDRRRLCAHCPAHGRAFLHTAHLLSGHGRGRGEGVRGIFVSTAADAIPRQGRPKRGSRIWAGIPSAMNWWPAKRLGWSWPSGYRTSRVAFPVLVRRFRAYSRNRFQQVVACRARMGYSATTKIWADQCCHNIEEQWRRCGDLRNVWGARRHIKDSLRRLKRPSPGKDRKLAQHPTSGF